MDADECLVELILFDDDYDNNHNDNDSDDDDDVNKRYYFRTFSVIRLFCCCLRKI